MRTRAKRKFVAKATALGARVPQAELFVLLIFGKKYMKTSCFFGKLYYNEDVNNS